MKFLWIEVLGWYGVLAILGAYTLVSLSVLMTSSVLYQLLNLSGAVAVATAAIRKRDAQPAVLNFIWALVALVALWRLWVN